MFDVQSGFATANLEQKTENWHGFEVTITRKFIKRSNVFVVRGHIQ